MITLVMTMGAGRSFPATPPESEIVLPVTINEVPAGEASVIISGDDVYVPIATLELGRVTGLSWERILMVARLRNVERSIDGTPALSLRSLAPWTTFRLDEETLTLAITIDPALIAGSAIAIRDPRPPDIVYSHDTSTFLNYAVSSQGLSDLSAFAEIGSSIRGNLLYTALSSSPGRGLTRGLTHYTIDQRQHLRRLVFGDATVFGDELGGSGIIGGATVARNFDLDPYFIRFPSMSLRGMA
ncbi:MAG TPA: hypothetical protein VNA04_01290, partial [Thermoanaerobaculia bacterium]|nr:hypothetical protein [Thermoanaerobaculia bacterium]